MLDYVNEWQFTTCYSGCLTDVYYTDGDTIVNGKPHKILDGYHYISRSFLLREEIAERKVYLTKINTNRIDEYLLYNFGLEVGDSIDMKNPITPFPEDAGFYTLDSIRNRNLVDGNTYRHFYLSPSTSNTVSSTNAIWIEGLGSLSIVTAPSGFPDINQVGHLSCGFKNRTLVYSNLDSITGCSPNHLYVDDFKNPLEEVIVTTLVSNNSTIEIDNALYVTKATLNSLTGKKIKTSIFSVFDKSKSMQLPSLNQGVYLLRLYNNKGATRVFKIVIQ